MDNICCCIENEIRCNKQSEPNKPFCQKHLQCGQFSSNENSINCIKNWLQVYIDSDAESLPNSNPLFRQMFGHGIYFADLAYKSLNYSNNIRNRCVEFYSQPPTYNGWLLLSSMTVSGPITVASYQGYTESLSDCYEMTLQESGYKYEYNYHSHPQLELDDQLENTIDLLY